MLIVDESEQRRLISMKIIKSGEAVAKALSSFWRCQKGLAGTINCVQQGKKKREYFIETAQVDGMWERKAEYNFAILIAPKIGSDQGLPTVMRIKTTKLAIPLRNAFARSGWHHRAQEDVY